MNLIKGSRVLQVLFGGRLSHTSLQHRRTFLQRYSCAISGISHQNEGRHLTYCNVTSKQCYCSSKSETKSNLADEELEEDETKLSLFQRFKKAYKEHGKVLIGVHLVTSSVWFGSFYYAASSGLDIVGFLQSLGASESVLKPFRSGLGDIAAAYLMYKIATPARYTVTLGGTKLAIDYLKKKGRIQPVPHEDKLRSLYKESRDVLNDKRLGLTSKLKERGSIKDKNT